MLKHPFIFLIMLTACTGSSTIASGNGENDTAPLTQSDAETNRPAPEQIELHFEQSLRYQNIELRVTQIEDSRCAIGVTCIWAGQMLVGLEVTADDGDPTAIKLLHKREAQAVEIFGYSFKLLNIEPHPKKGRVTSINEQIVHLQITKT